MGQVFDRFDNLTHHRFGAPVRVLQDHSEPANAFNERRHVGLPKLLFKQYQIAFPCVDASFDARDILNGLNM